MIKKLKQRSSRKRYFTSTGSHMGIGQKAHRQTFMVKRTRRGKFSVRKHK